MLVSFFKKLFPSKIKRRVKEHLDVPSLHWSLQNLKNKNFKPLVVLDIGAYEGLWTLDLLEVFPEAKVLMVEAQESKEPFLKTVKHEYAQVDYAISLLSSEDGVLKSFGENETASAVIKNEELGGQYKHIKSETLDTPLKKKNFPLPDLLKFDVQGHEMEVLLGADKALAHAEICLLEISLFDLGEDVPLLAEMVSFMDRRDFQAYDISQFIRRPFDKALFQVDMFFVKKSSGLIAGKHW
jgi:FkbM family methyltransferase